ncbi:MAG: hypothetical protein K0U38_03940 [Epsilonproteobacteria bacterium]|nr:hypothetical protein [Campylobacterota bacterium]
MKKIITTLLLTYTILQAHIDDKVLYAFEAKCMSCHDTYKKNDKAPPLVAVNQVYLRLADGNFSKAMERMKTFLTKPTKEKTLMKPAVKLFGVMPNLELNSTEVEDFSQVLVETEFEIPDWFDGHYKSHELNKTE